MPYTDALNKLERLGIRKLLAYDYERNGEYCVFGILCPSTRKYRDMDRDIFIAANMDDDVMKELWGLNMTLKEAVWLQKVCDGIEPTSEETIFGARGETSEQRCRRVISWLRDQEMVRVGEWDRRAEANANLR